jgi:hypothetical protein
MTHDARKYSIVSNHKTNMLMLFMLKGAWRNPETIHKRGLCVTTPVSRAVIFLDKFYITPLKHFPCFLMPWRILYFRRP